MFDAVGRMFVFGSHGILPKPMNRSVRFGAVAVAALTLESLGVENERGDAEMLEPSRDEASTKGCEKRSGKQIADHVKSLGVFPPLVAGEAHGVAGIVGAVMQAVIAGEAGADQ